MYFNSTHVFKIYILEHTACSYVTKQQHINLPLSKVLMNFLNSIKYSNLFYVTVLLMSVASFLLNYIFDLGLLLVAIQLLLKQRIYFK